MGITTSKSSSFEHNEEEEEEKQQQQEQQRLKRKRPEIIDSDNDSLSNVSPSVSSSTDTFDFVSRSNKRQKVNPPDDNGNGSTEDSSGSEEEETMKEPMQPTLKSLTGLLGNFSFRIPKPLVSPHPEGGVELTWTEHPDSYINIMKDGSFIATHRVGEGDWKSTEDQDPRVIENFLLAEWLEKNSQGKLPITINEEKEEKQENVAITKKSDSELVDEFTRGSSLVPLPECPDGSPFTLSEIRFVCRMVAEELLELVTVHYSRDEKLTNDQVIRHAKKFLQNAVNTCDTPKVDLLQRGQDNLQVLASEVDAFGDAVYFLHNACSKKGISLSSVVATIHRANMDKRFPDGTFHKRESDKKIIKPEGWTEPDIVAEIRRQMSGIKQ